MVIDTFGKATRTALCNDEVGVTGSGVGFYPMSWHAPQGYKGTRATEIPKKNPCLKDSSRLGNEGIWVQSSSDVAVVACL